MEAHPFDHSYKRGLKKAPARQMAPPPLIISGIALISAGFPLFFASAA
jgi:hypothetical protein